MSERIELRDAQGKLYGYFIPAQPNERQDYAEVRKLFNRQELKRRKKRAQTEPGRTLDQIMDRLRSKEKGG